MTIPPDYKHIPSDFILGRNEPVNLRNEGKCINMYLNNRNYYRLKDLRKRMGLKTWNEFITWVLRVEVVKVKIDDIEKEQTLL